MTRFLFLFVPLLLMMSACAPAAAPEAETLDGQTLLQDSVDLVREAETLSMIVEQGGTPFRFLFQLAPDQPEFVTVMSRAEAAYIAPDGLWVDARIQFQGFPINVQLLAKEETQWVRALGLPYVEFIFAPGFNPMILMAQDTGFNRAMSQLDVVAYIGRETRNRVETHHVRGEADGEVINDLLFGLLEILEERVVVDVFIDVETGYPSEILLTLPDTAQEADEAAGTEATDDTFWRIEIFDVNEPVDVETPQGVTL